MSLPTHRTSTRVVGQGLEAASPSVTARTVGARVVRDGDFAKGGLVSNRARAFKDGSAGWRHYHGARSAVLAFLTSGIAGILILTVFSGESRWTSTKKKKRGIMIVSICSRTAISSGLFLGPETSVQNGFEDTNMRYYYY